MSTDTGLELGPKSLASSVGDFVADKEAYYNEAFAKIQGKTGIAWSWNWAAALAGPLWGAFRGLWGFFWTFLVLELFALVQLGRGLWGDLGADKMARYEKLAANIEKRREQASELTASGDQVGADAALKVAGNLEKAAQKALGEAEAASAEAFTILFAGLALLLVIKIVEGFYGNVAYEKQYLRWRARPDTPSGVSWANVAFGGLLLLGIWPLTIYRFTFAKPAEILTKFPMNKEWFTPVANWMEGWFDWLAIEFGDVFKGVTAAIKAVLDGLEIILVQTPWPVVMLVIVVMAWRLAGPRIAVFTAAALAYLATFGLWEVSMVTVALLGAAAFLCLVIGIPLGIWFGKSSRAYAAALPILDFMQTMPAFVYLIPIIAFFGTGKPPGVLATIIFAMPPVIRLTALGMRQVPEGTKEAAVAFGCTKWQLLSNVEIPLAMPSIMTGINQTILMCLSMVVIASLIGAGGLGANILEALQYAAKGQGMLAGLAILFCAMVIDRIIQGMYRRRMESA
ncbi:MAG: ABC transporter permease subunit [Alphaproteobacteria bacterium]|nr:ABC transporter permease subunit [Alphaproteobacteria bacterium]